MTTLRVIVNMVSSINFLLRAVKFFWLDKKVLCMLLCSRKYTCPPSGISIFIATIVAIILICPSDKFWMSCSYWTKIMAPLSHSHLNLIASSTATSLLPSLYLYTANYKPDLLRTSSRRSVIMTLLSFYWVFMCFYYYLIHLIVLFYQC